MPLHVGNYFSWCLCQQDFHHALPLTNPSYNCSTLLPISSFIIFHFILVCRLLNLSHTFTFTHYSEI
jgi:hypothetical protein